MIQTCLPRPNSLTNSMHFWWADPSNEIQNYKKMRRVGETGDGRYKIYISHHISLMKKTFTLHLSGSAVSPIMFTLNVDIQNMKMQLTN